jgi:hypothetical protein
MRSEMQPRVMRAQKRGIQISRVTNLLIKNFIFSVELEVFLQLFSKPNRKHVISLMIRKKHIFSYNIVIYQANRLKF